MIILLRTPYAGLDIRVSATSNVGKLLSKATLSNSSLHERLNKIELLCMTLEFSSSVYVGVPELRKGRISKNGMKLSKSDLGKGLTGLSTGAGGNKPLN